jgi:hypothetical protein
MARAAHELDSIDEMIAWADDDLGLTHDEVGALLGVRDRTLHR